ncbi:MAG TPA: hypothetical protein VJU82_15050, partial [Acidobacteriaceae bacterium]|nr:hypothetical protein [Acidobacteriaceae bacterium]
VSHVDGWKAVDRVGAFLAERAAARKQALVVIAGGSGTGRTSLANVLIHKWADGRPAAQGVAFDRTQLIVACGRMSDYADADQLWQWVLGLWPQILTAGFAPGEQTERAFDTLRDSKPEALARALQNTLIKLVNDLSSRNWALAGILEDIKKQELLRLASTSFEYVDSLLVMTVEDTAGNFDAVLNRVETALDPDASRLVRLSELDGSEARDVVVSRWLRSAEDPSSPLPFDESSVQAGFDGRRRPIARVLKLMETLLAMKVSYGNGKPERWPAAGHLAFTEEEVAHKIAYLDSELFPRS